MVAPERTSTNSNATWTSGQAYALALICLGVGLVLGYLFRGSESPTPTTAGVPASQQMPANAPMPGPASLPGSTAPPPEMTPQEAEQKAQPLLVAVKQNSKDVESLIALGNLYYDSRQLPQAVSYYEKALAIDPKNVNVRTDMGTAYWYMGNPDRAISEFERSLSYQPTHAVTLRNMGVVKWQGKHDPAGAVSAWEKLLKTNPDFSGRQDIEQMIAQAKQHASR